MTVGCIKGDSRLLLSVNFLGSFEPKLIFLLIWNSLLWAAPNSWNKWLSYAPGPGGFILLVNTGIVCVTGFPYKSSLLSLGEFASVLGGGRTNPSFTFLRIVELLSSKSSSLVAAVEFILLLDWKMFAMYFSSAFLGPYETYTFEAKLS